MSNKFLVEIEKNNKKKQKHLSENIFLSWFYGLINISTRTYSFGILNKFRNLSQFY